MDCMTLASVMDVLSTIWYIFLVIIGFTAVIFVHELGHFLAAKKVGIRVERFAIGFGPRLLGFKWGETDYCVNLLPLGGYVKMSGQEDFHLEKEAVPDPHAFNNATVGARSLVIGAGVVMNVIFAAVLFMIVFMFGKDFPAAQIGDVPFESPAYGVLKPGDRPLVMDGPKVADGRDLQLIPALYNSKEPMVVTVLHRDGTTSDVKLDPKAARGGILDGLRTIGVTFDFHLRVPSADDDAAEIADKVKESLLAGDVKPGDRIVRANDQPVKFWSDLVNLAQASGGQPLLLTIERGEGSDMHTVSATLKVELVGSSIPELQLLGAHPRMAIDRIEKKMPADGVLKLDDQIVRVEDVKYPLFGQLTRIVTDRRYEKVSLDVIRDGKLLTLTIKPKTWWYRRGVGQLGIGPSVYGEQAALGMVSEDSALGRGGVPSGATVLAVRAATTQPTTLPADSGPMNWSGFYRGLVALAGQKANVFYISDSGVSEVRSIDVPPLNGWENGITFRPRPLLLDLVVKTYKTRNPLVAAGMGARECGQFIVQAYVTLDRLFTSETVGVKHLSGPVGIAYGSYKTARSGPIYLMYFLAMISANLAVVNFLPLPIVDGGLMVFLIYEKLRRRPVSLKVMQATQIVGFVLIIGLFLWITWQDILRLLLG